MAASTTWPLPELRASSTAHTTPKASIMAPPPKSPTRFSGGAGGVAGAAHRVQHAGQRDVVEVVAGRLRQRAVLAPAGHAAVHQPRVARVAGVRAEAEPLHHAGAEAFEQHVGLLRPAPAPLRCAAGCFRSSASERRPRAITSNFVPSIGNGLARARRRLAVDADHFRAHVGQHHGGERARPQAHHFNDAYSCQRSCHALSPYSERAMISFMISLAPP